MAERHLHLKKQVGAVRDEWSLTATELYEPGETLLVAEDEASADLVGQLEVNAMVSGSPTRYRIRFESAPSRPMTARESIDLWNLISR